MATIAIDFGSTKIVSAFLGTNGRANIITDVTDVKNRWVVNCIAFLQNQRLFGRTAEYQAGDNGMNTIYGRDLRQLITKHNVDKFCPIKIVESDPFPVIVVQYKGQLHHVHVVQLIAMMLRHVKTKADEFLQTHVTQCSITIPFVSTFEQMDLMQNAGLIAGFSDVKLVYNTTAAALIYATEINEIRNKHLILILDIGGSSTEASIARIEGNSVIIEARAGQVDLGGDNFDTRLLQHFMNEFWKINSSDLDFKTLTRLRVGCKDLKEMLGKIDPAKVTLEVFHNGNPFDLILTRVAFELMCEDIFAKLIDVVRKVFEQCFIAKNEIEKVILVGGGSRLPKIRQDLVNFMEGKELSCILNRDEANAEGAAHYANNYSNVRDIVKKQQNPPRFQIDVQKMQKFIQQVENDENEVFAYKSALIELEALCYRFKRESKKRDISQIHQDLIVQCCTQTIQWIKKNYESEMTIEMIQMKENQLKEINLAAPVEEAPEDIAEPTQPVQQDEILIQIDDNLPIQDPIEVLTRDAKLIETPPVENMDTLEPANTSQDQQVSVLVDPIETEYQMLLTKFEEAHNYLLAHYYNQAYEIFTQILTSDAAQMFDVNKLYELRGKCSYYSGNYELCLADLTRIPSTDSTRKLYRVAENRLYKVTSNNVLEESQRLFSRGDEMSKATAISMISNALEKRPDNQMISNIRITSELLHCRALFHFNLNSYTEAIKDIFDNVRLIDDIPELKPQRDAMYQKIFEKIKSNNRLQQNIEKVGLGAQFLHIKRCLSNAGFKESKRCTIL